MGPKKIFLLKSSFAAAKGGLEKASIQIATMLAEKGHQVVLLTSGYTGKASFPFRIENICKKKKMSFLHLLHFDRAAKQYLQSSSYDAVLGLDRNSCLQTHYRAGNGCHAAFLQHRKRFSSFLKMATIYCNPLHKLILKMERDTFLSPQLQHLFCNSFLVKDEILAAYPAIEEEKIKVIHNGVAFHTLQEPFDEGFTRREEIQRELGLNPKCFQFLFVGNEYKRKGLLPLLEALSLLKNSDFELTVIGKERKSAFYKEKAYALGLGERVHFKGLVTSSVLPFYQAADALVVPSYYDPFANVTVEALAMGLFVISSPCNGGKEVIQEGVSGTVFPSFESEEVAKSLEYALTLPKNKERALSIRKSIAHLEEKEQLQKIVSYI